MVTAAWIFWVAAAIVAYVYVGYPMLLAVWARLSPKRTKKIDDGPLPSISIIVAARNEGRRLAGRLENLLSIDYPAPRQVIVVSDGSTDNTVAVVRRFAPRVELVTQRALGKAAALNAGVARARNPILVFADARQRFARDTLRQLVANFADPGVGAVSGQLLLDCEAPAGGTSTSSVADGVGLYWRYEKWLREREGSVASTLGATGAVYAMRRRCWQPLPADTILDDVLAPMRVVLAGKRVVFDESALAFDRTAPDAATESRRKVRTLAGNFQLLWLEPRLLMPFVNPVWLQFVSHKLGRLLVPYALIACLVTSALLSGSSLVYAGAFVAQLALVLLAAYGALLDARTGSTTAVGPAAAPLELDDEQRSSTKRIVNA